MNQVELVACLSGDFYENFAGQTAARVCEADAVGLLYTVVTSPLAEFPKPVRHKVWFRGAYVLERIYFADPAFFTPYAAMFCGKDFPACTDASARRHFAKIMADLLRRYEPAPDCFDRIADTAVQWMLDPKAKVSVKVWTVEILKCCRERVCWVADMWEDLLEMLQKDATPGIECRMRKSWKDKATDSDRPLK